MHKKNNIDITKKTHAGHHYAALTARAHGASTSGTKALGGWNESSSFNSVYDRAFPLDVLLGAAMYNGRHPEEYTLPHGCLGRLLAMDHVQMMSGCLLICLQCLQFPLETCSARSFHSLSQPRQNCRTMFDSCRWRPTLL